MHSAAYSASPLPRAAISSPLVFGRPLLSRRWALAAIALLHVAVFYAITQGMLTMSVHVETPREVFVNMIAAPTPAKTPPAVPKPVIEHFRQQPELTVPVIETIIHEAPAAVNVPVAVQSKPQPPQPVMQAQAAPAPPAVPKTVSSGIEYLRAPQPQYPAMSRKLGEQGTVMLRVYVNEQGHPERVEVSASSGSARLDEAARQAVLRSLFKPYSEGGVALAMYAMVPILFNV